MLDFYGNGYITANSISSHMFVWRLPFN
jgi:Ca2+-binding EF-hand superfamily protein